MIDISDLKPRKHIRRIDQSCQRASEAGELAFDWSAEEELRDLEISSSYSIEQEIRRKMMEHRRKRTAKLA